MRNKRQILLVEDDKVDAMTTRRALKELNITNELVVKENGEAALEFLQDPEQALPCIILLDLNMPKMNGIEFLNVVKRDGELRHIPVIVLTTSTMEQDRTESFNLGVAGYMRKPVDYIQFVEVIKIINLYWTISELPSE